MEPWCASSSGNARASPCTSSCGNMVGKTVGKTQHVKTAGVCRPVPLQAISVESGALASFTLLLSLDVLNVRAQPGREWWAQKSARSESASLHRAVSRDSAPLPVPCRRPRQPSSLCRDLVSALCLLFIATVSSSGCICRMHSLSNQIAAAVLSCF